jgi:hypothetical protein
MRVGRCARGIHVVVVVIRFDSGGIRVPCRLGAFLTMMVMALASLVQLLL